MLSIFRTNQILTGILLLPYVLLLYASVLFVPQVSSDPESYGILSEFIYNWLGDRTLMSNIVAGLLLWLQSFMINFISLRHRLQNELNLLPGLFYIFLCSCIPDFLYLSPILMGNTFFIIALAQIMESYKKTAVAEKIFNVGFWLGVAGLFYFSFNILIIWGIIGVGLLRGFRVNEILQVVSGLIVVLLLAGTIYYWNGDFDVFLSKQFTSNLSFWDFGSKLDYSIWIKGGIIALLVIIAFFSFSKFVSKRIMQVQRKISVIYRALFVILITLLFQAGISIEHLLMFMVPLSFFMSIYFTDMKRSLAETLHLILLVAVLVFQFQPFLFALN